MLFRSVPATSLRIGREHVSIRGGVCDNSVLTANGYFDHAHGRRASEKPARRGQAFDQIEGLYGARLDIQRKLIKNSLSEGHAQVARS